MPDISSLGSDRAKRRFDWRQMLGHTRDGTADHSTPSSQSDLEASSKQILSRWNMGILNDRQTEEVPGSILLLSKVSKFNEPLGLRNAPARTSVSSLPSSLHPPSPGGSRRRRSKKPDKKRTADGKIILEPQPDDSLNDPLNWTVWRRDAALLSLGFYCMVGGGMTPALAAGFHDVAAEYDVSLPQVALTTGLYMMGLGVGSVILSPTAILFGKRPVYLAASVCFVLTAVWCALSPTFPSLIVARIFMGIAVSSVECLPSASIAEIYFLHEKAYRLGIYTLLLLGGKNLVPLVSAAIIQSLGWRWVFWVVAMVVGLGGCLLFLFVPETFWDRSPVPHQPRARRMSSSSSVFDTHARRRAKSNLHGDKEDTRHAHFRSEYEEKRADSSGKEEPREDSPPLAQSMPTDGQAPVLTAPDFGPATEQGLPLSSPISNTSSGLHKPAGSNPYTAHFSAQPPKSFVEQLRPWSGRLTHDSWFRVALRPFILFAYPSILWSALVYSLSIGWLIVLSESVSSIYENRDTYNFTALQAGLVYISPFVGGILGTAVAGKCSDILVRFMARRNGGIYEPEFRLIMGIPIAIFTTIGLMGYGWSAQEHDAWIVPTIFFGFISFGCSLGSTTSITFAVDSYRQYAGEALVTLNFSKNILHGLVFSLFFNRWLDAKGSKDVFAAIGGIQLACLLTTIPMYIYGKRARMWTVRKNLMEEF